MAVRVGSAAIAVCLFRLEKEVTAVPGATVATVATAGTVSLAGPEAPAVGLPLAARADMAN
ncbi:hypothetical protein MSHO_17580 [Mycobacterium shottsii]|uniref:Uncharacterized protein n=1 Tax=Mycobacterium shottsii TaxID=133549 RepID=A0A7I7LAY7_9MYCO|nr:hypothetical protein MSHO_17580 [Mycobacterium shottsii]